MALVYFLWPDLRQAACWGKKYPQNGLWRLCCWRFNFRFLLCLFFHGLSVWFFGTDWFLHDSSLVRQKRLKEPKTFFSSVFSFFVWNSNSFYFYLIFSLFPRTVSISPRFWFSLFYPLYSPLPLFLASSPIPKMCFLLDCCLEKR